MQEAKLRGAAYDCTPRVQPPPVHRSRIDTQPFFASSPTSPPRPLPDLPSPQDLSRADLPALLRDPARKQGFVTPMFEHIAPRYDAFTRLFSFGMDAKWKRTLVSWLKSQRLAPAHVLDVACGTGDLARAAANCWPNATVLGVDAAEAMVALAKVHPHPSTVTFNVGDLTALSLPDASQQAVTAGYAFRNVPDVQQALAEMSRIMSPDACLYVLDFYRPRQTLWRVLFLNYLRTAGSLVGWWWHRAPVIYAYIADSIDAWISVGEFEQALDRAGFDVVERQVHLGGGVALHQARRRR